ncbi:MAG: malonyl-ACP O-methyltransferase BioC [Succinivibrio sp.]|nr:malonyl-ACP O-methyltransferase BioC [Succinivibrio sp.]
MISSKALNRSFSLAAATYTEAASMQARMAGILAQRIPVYAEAKPVKVLELGCGTGLFTSCLLEKLAHTRLTLCLNDLSAPMLRQCLKTVPEGLECETRCGDLRQIELGSDYDLIASNCVLQWIDPLQETLKRLALSLKDGGVLLFSDFGVRHFEEIKALTGIGLDYLSVSELKAALAAAGFEAEIHEELIKLDYASVKELLRSLALSGVNRVGQGLWTAQRLQKFRLDYEARFSSAKGVYLSWDMRYVLARRRAL